MDSVVIAVFFYYINSVILRSSRRMTLMNSIRLAA